MGIKSGAYDFPNNATMTGGGPRSSLIGGAKYFFTETGPVRFYVLAGIGLNSNSYKDATGQWTVVTPGYTATITRTESFDSDGGFGILAGPGLSFALGPKFSIYAEIRYASALGKTMYLPILIGAQMGL
jgi:opacity protein-like surface antigen